MAHQNPSDKNYKSTNFCQKTTIEESESVCYSLTGTMRRNAMQ